ncbi:MAG: tetratricopeptide repeat protein [Oscillochloridaceae bacterium umkhey_bin13]
MGAERDARAVAAVLDAPACGFAVELRTGEQLSADTLKRQIEELLYEATAESDLFFYFSGHALPVARGPRDSETFLVTGDFDAKRAARFPERYLSLRWLYENLYRDENARSVVIFLDCCFAGDILGIGDDQLTLNLRDAIEQFRNGRDAQTRERYLNKLRVIIPVVGPGQKAREQQGAGIATKVLLNLLNGTEAHEHLDDGRVTVKLLIDRLEKALPDHAPAPMLAGQGLFVLADHQAAVAAARLPTPADHAARREQLLRALLHDHSGFIANRLESFVGRETEMAEIRARIAAVRETGGYVTVTGQAGQGKSSIIARLLHEFGVDGTAHHFIPIKPGPDHQVGLMLNILARLIFKHDLNEIYVASDSRPALRDYFAQALREIADMGRQELIVIDGLDQIEEDLNGERDLSFLPLEPPSGIVFLLGTRPNDALKPLELRKPHTEYWLPNLSREDFALILAHRGVTNLDASLVERFYRAMHENALYLDLVARELTQPNALNPELLIARIADDPENLFSLSIERLRADRQRWRTVLKPILGLLLAARDPLSERAIRALANTAGDECHDGLQRLGGLLARDGEGRYYLYHLKFADFLREDPGRPQRAFVFTSDDEESYHQMLADWCVGGQGGIDAIWQASVGHALERERRKYAQLHYIPHLAAARSYAQLWDVIDTGAYGRAKLRHDPSGRSYVLDLDTVRDAVINSANGEAAAEVAMLPRLWRYSLLRGTIADRADNIADDLLLLMAQLGREQEAVNSAELLTDPLRKAFALLQIAVVCKEIPATSLLSQQLIARAQTMLSDLCRQAPQRLIDLLNNGERADIIIKFLLTGEPKVIEAVSHAMAQIAWERVPSEDTRTILTLIAIVLRIARSLIQTGQFSAVLPVTLLDDLAEETLNIPEILKTIGSSLVQTNDLDHVLTSIATITMPEVKLPILVAVAFGLEHVGRAQEGQQIWQQVMTSIHAEHDRDRHEPRANAAAILILLDHFDEAITAARAIKDAARRTYALTAVATSLVHAQRFDQATSVIEETLLATRVIENANQRANALKSIATTLAQTQRFEQATSVLEEALTIARVVVFDDDRADILESIATTLAQIQQFDQAASVLEEALTTARVVEPYILVSILTAMARNQRFDAALAASYTIDDAKTRAYALDSIATALAQDQIFETATR